MERRSARSLMMRLIEKQCLSKGEVVEVLIQAHKTEYMGHQNSTGRRWKPIALTISKNVITAKSMEIL